MHPDIMQDWNVYKTLLHWQKLILRLSSDKEIREQLSDMVWVSFFESEVNYEHQHIMSVCSKTTPSFRNQVIPLEAHTKRMHFCIKGK